MQTRLKIFNNLSLMKAYDNFEESVSEYTDTLKDQLDSENELIQDQIDLLEKQKKL